MMPISFWTRAIGRSIEAERDQPLVGEPRIAEQDRPAERPDDGGDQEGKDHDREQQAAPARRAARDEQRHRVAREQADQGDDQADPDRAVQRLLADLAVEQAEDVGEVRPFAGLRGRLQPLDQQQGAGRHDKHGERQENRRRQAGGKAAAALTAGGTGARSRLDFGPARRRVGPQQLDGARRKMQPDAARRPGIPACAVAISGDGQGGAIDLIDDGRADIGEFAHRSVQGVRSVRRRRASRRARRTAISSDRIPSTTAPVRRLRRRDMQHGPAIVHRNGNHGVHRAAALSPNRARETGFRRPGNRRHRPMRAVPISLSAVPRRRPCRGSSRRSGRERVSASSWSWVTKIEVTPVSRWMRFSSKRISARSLASRLDSGSSSSSTSGRITSARASATRCCWPPDSWRG